MEHQDLAWAAIVPPASGFEFAEERRLMEDQDGPTGSENPPG
jgi:hypothetical protein